METTVTSKGQLTLPQPIRQALGIDAGTVLEVELGAEGSIAVSYTHLTLPTSDLV